MGIRAIVVGVVLAVAGVGCSAPDDATVVSVAASLGPAFEELQKAYERANPESTIELNIAGSVTLAEQIIAGAPVDVLALADMASMDRALGSVDTTGPAITFASNSMVIGVPRGNPAAVTSLSDFARSELFLGACAIPVPCGVYARQVFDAAGVVPDLDTQEADVRALVVKLDSGDLDAAIVYATDVSALSGIDGVATGVDVIAEYPIVDVTGTPDSVRFVEFVLSAEGQSILGDFGFGAP